MTIARRIQETRTSSAAEERVAVLFWILVAGAAGMAALLALLPAAGHDQLWFLLMARRWLDGAVLYGPQAFDSNPPGIVWISAVPVILEHWTHLPATFWGKALVILLGSGCLLLCFRLLARAWRPLRPRDMAALLFAAMVLFGAVPARDFGQRDHLVSLLLLPYLLTAGIRGRGVGLVARGTAGVLALSAICLKPHHALVPLVVEVALLSVSRRPWAIRLRHLGRPETMLIFMGGLLYLAAIRRFTPLYLTEAVPLTRQVYAGIGHLKLPQLLWEAVELCILAVLAAWLALRKRPLSPAVRFLLLAGTASLAAYLLQGTGWYYQQLPAIVFFGLALALAFLDWLDAHPVTVPAWLPRAALALVVIALGLTTHFTGYPFTQDRAFAIETPNPALFRGLPAGTPVAILTTSVDEAMMPMERYGLTWAQRTDNLWLLPEVLRAERPEGQPVRHAPSPSQVAALDVLEHHWMVKDLTHWEPRLVLVERCQDEAVRCQVLEDRHDDLLAWFSRDPAFAALWQQRYVFQRRDGRFDVYVLR